jgi:hypothetical protein
MGHPNLGHIQIEPISRIPFRAARAAVGLVIFNRDVNPESLLTLHIGAFVALDLVPAAQFLLPPAHATEQPSSAADAYGEIMRGWRDEGRYRLPSIVPMNVSGLASLRQEPARDPKNWRDPVNLDSQLEVPGACLLTVDRCERTEIVIQHGHNCYRGSIKTVDALGTYTGVLDVRSETEEGVTAIIAAAMTDFKRRW